MAGPTGFAVAELFESILEELPNPVFVKDEQHRWVILNESFCRLMGHPRDALLGRSDHDFFPQHEADVFWAKDDLVFATEELNENEESFTDASGREHVILTRKTVQRDAHGRRFLVGVITDITERKRIEEELRRSRDELDSRVRARTAELEAVNLRLQEADRRKNEFIGVLSHELRNPLAPIVHALHLLDREEPGDASRSTAREVIKRQLEHLTRLVDDLLDVTRISRGKIQLQRERVDLADTVLRTVEDHRSLFTTRGLVLELQAPPGRFPVYADATRLAQIVGNLLQNAAKFTPAGGAVEVSLARDDEGRARLRVADTGIGIPPALLERVFEPFIQGEQTLQRGSGGLGLGLALVKGLAELHGGAAEAHSRGPGLGTEVVVTLPLAREGDGAPARPARPAVARRRRILIVEDNADAAEMLQMLLEEGGHEVAVAHDGEKGLARARTFHPDLVLCDLGLPAMDGYAVARALRADPELARAELVAVSGYALPEDQRLAREAGFDRHLAKPVSVEQLESVLRAPAPAR